MIVLLFLIPVFAIVSGLAVYHKNGKKEILKFDVVQFSYAFVLAPILFIWFKSFLFLILREELDLNLTINGIYILDTVFSVMFMYVYSFVVIHSLTKSFENKRYKDPLYDVFQHSETLHLWVSHLGIYAGVMALVSMVSLVNLSFPASWLLPQVQFYGIILLAWISGVVVFSAVWLSTFDDRFLRLIKLLYGVFFILHVVAYMMFDPKFNSRYVMFWFVTTFFTMLVVLSLFFERSDRAVNWVEKLMHKKGWSAKKKKYMLSK